MITDYNMPSMDGYQLADWIKEKYFGTKVIIMTGCYQEDILDTLIASRIVDGFLLKPFNLSSMKGQIANVLHPSVPNHMTISTPTEKEEVCMTKRVVIDEDD